MQTLVSAVLNPLPGTIVGTVKRKEPGLRKKIAAKITKIFTLRKWTLIWDDEWHAHYELKWKWSRNEGNGRKVHQLPPL